MFVQCRNSKYLGTTILVVYTKVGAFAAAAMLCSLSSDSIYLQVLIAPRVVGTVPSTYDSHFK